MFFTCWLRRNGKNLFCSITEFSSIFLLYNTFMPIDCHGLCNSAVNSLHYYHIYLNVTTPTPQIMSAKKKYFTINYMHLINKACQIVSTFTNQYHCVHLHNQCHLPHSLLTCLSSLMPFHNKSSLFPSTALLKCLHSHFWWDALPCCYDPLIKKLSL